MTEAWPVLLAKLWSWFQILMVLGGIILVHEFGHFIVAKASRMKVEEFSIGVGPTLYRWRRGETTYRLCLFLFMGYVRIVGLEGEADAAELPGSFYTRPYWQRVAVIVAGAAFNVLSAALLFCLLYGVWGVLDERQDNTIISVLPGSPAAAAELEPGWRITSVNGQPTPLYEDIAEIIEASEGQPLRLSLERPERVKTVRLVPRRGDRALDALGLTLAADGTVRAVRPASPAAQAGIEAGWRLRAVGDTTITSARAAATALARSADDAALVRLERPARGRQVTVRPEYVEAEGKHQIGVSFLNDLGATDVIDRVTPGGPADQAGLRAGDRIVAVGGSAFEHPGQIEPALLEVPESLEKLDPNEVVLPPVQVTYAREGIEHTTWLQPEVQREQRPLPPAEGEVIEDFEDLASRPLESYLVAEVGLTLERRYQRLGLAASLKRGSIEAYDFVANVLDSVGLLVQGKGWAQVGGPLQIVKTLHRSTSAGWYDMLWWAGVLSIMIGTFNLLPLPALDGGRLVFIAIDWLMSVFGRRGLNHRAEAWVHAVGLILLLGLMILVSVRDVARW